MQWHKAQDFLRKVKIGSSYCPSEGIPSGLQPTLKLPFWKECGKLGPWLEGLFTMLCVICQLQGKNIQSKKKSRLDSMDLNKSEAGEEIIVLQNSINT